MSTSGSSDCGSSLAEGRLAAAAALRVRKRAALLASFSSRTTSAERSTSVSAVAGWKRVGARVTCTQSLKPCGTVSTCGNVFLGEACFPGGGRLRAIADATGWCNDVVGAATTSHKGSDCQQYRVTYPCVCSRSLIWPACRATLHLRRSPCMPALHADQSRMHVAGTSHLQCRPALQISHACMPELQITE